MPAAARTTSAQRVPLSLGGEAVGEESTGVFNQSGGTHTISSGLAIGYFAGNGTYNLSGNTLLAVSGAELIGGYAASTGTFVPEWRHSLRCARLDIAADDPSDTGSYSISSGTLNATGTTTVAAIQIGTSGATGTFTQTGGTVNARNPGSNFNNSLYIATLGQQRHVRPLRRDADVRCQ